MLQKCWEAMWWPLQMHAEIPQKHGEFMRWHRRMWQEMWHYRSVPSAKAKVEFAKVKHLKEKRP